MRTLLQEPIATAEMERLQGFVAATELDFWEEAVGNPAGLRSRAPQPLLEQLDLVAARHPLELLGVLRGLCTRALPNLYLETEDQIVLDRGMPIPFATRPLHKRMPTTPYQRTLANGHLVEKLPFWLFEGSAGADVRVVLDFSRRERIDELAWSEEKGLPRIATLHPRGGGPIDTDEIAEGKFFGVRPKHWDLDSVLDRLRSVGDVEVAVLPELSMPFPDALEEALTTDPNSYPALIVAGSAHVHHEEEGLVKSNECHVYLDGEHVITHRKCHPYETRRVGSVTLPEPVVEGITREPKTITVLSGSVGRFGVVICSDLNDRSIPGLLTNAGVNLLAVPSRSPSFGSFNGAIGGIASLCQGVAVIANSEPDGAAPDEEQFRIGLAVPRTERQSDAFPGPAGDGLGEVAVVDPNQPLAEAINWR